MTKAKQARADELGMDKAALIELYDELDYLRQSRSMNMYGAAPVSHEVRVFPARGE